MDRAPLCHHGPMTTQRGDVGRGFTQGAGEYDDLLARNAEGARRLVAAMPEGDYPEVLDVGCGTGFASLAFAERFRPRRIVGVDASEGMLEVFRAKTAGLAGVDVELRQADVTAMGVPDGAFDAVISAMAFHWFPDKAAAAHAMAAALRPGGALALLTAGRGTDAEFREVLRSIRPPVPPNYDATFDAVQRDVPEVEAYLAEAGLEVRDAWMEQRVRTVPVERYLGRMRVTAGHVSDGVPEPEMRELTERITAATAAAAGPDGFRYTFNKVYAIAWRPG
jgi:ubiquinone/menaquinone biosynthesis C-methylase UbiE